MQLQNIDFLKQYRMEDIGLPGEGRQYGNVYFMYPGSNRRDRQMLKRFLGNYIIQSDLVGRLVSDAEREEWVVNRRLREYMKKLLRTFADYSRQDPYEAHYYVRLSAEMHRFMDLAECCQGQMQMFFLDKLRNLVSRGKRLESKDICVMELVVGKYLDIAYGHHDIFTDLLHEELTRTGTDAVASPVEEALFKLTTLIKSQIFSIEATLGRLDELKKRWRELEAQGVYN